MSGDTLLSHLPVKFYSDEMTETKKIIYLERKFHELDEFNENIPEVAWCWIYFYPKYNSSGLGDWAWTAQISNCKHSCSSSFRCFSDWILLLNIAWMLWIRGLNGLKDIIKLRNYSSTLIMYQKLESKPQSIYTPLQGVKRPF